MSKRFLSVLLALIMILSAAAAWAEAPASTLLVTVNGEEIREDNAFLQIWQNSIMSQDANNGLDVSSEESIISINQRALDYTIQTLLMRQELAKRGQAVTADDIAANESAFRADWENVVTSFMANYGITEESSEEDRVAARADALSELENQYGYTEDLYVAESGIFYDLEETIERIRAIASEGVTVTDEDVDAYFAELVANDQEMFENNTFMYEYYTNMYGYKSSYVPEGYRGVTHILLGVDQELLDNWQALLARLEEAQEDTAAEPVADTEPAAESTDAPAAEAADVPAEEPVTQEMVDAARQAILDEVQPLLDEIKAKLDAGASFEDLILEYGTDPGMQDEATRKNGYAVHQDSIVWDPEFTKASMALEKIGDISDPLVTQFGVHLIQYLRDIPGGAVELTDELRAELKPVVQSEKENDAMNALIDQWLEEAAIEWTEEGSSWQLNVPSLAEGEPEAEAEAVPAE